MSVDKYPSTFSYQEVTIVILNELFSATPYCSNVNSRESGFGKRRNTGKECRIPGTLL